MNKEYSVIVLAIVLIFSTKIVFAETSNIDNILCTPSWYCSAYSDGACGSRNCIDVNACGLDDAKPSEFLECQTPNSLDKGIAPEGFFTVNSEYIKTTVEQDTVSQKIIKINSTTPQDYSLEIEYPSAYTKGTKFVTTSVGSKHIDTIGDFSIIIDARDIIVGTYVMPLKIYNEKYNKSIILTIDVIQKNIPIIGANIDSGIKIAGIDYKIDADIDKNSAKLFVDDNITYNLIDFKGDMLSSKSVTIEDPSKLMRSIYLPKAIDEGYYTLTINVESKSGNYAASRQFTVFPQNKYIRVVEKPSNAGNKGIKIAVIIVIIVIILFAAALIYIKKVYKKYNYNIRYKSYKNRGKNMFQYIIQKIISFKKKETGKPENKLELLKKSYERGFISEKEYNDAVRNYKENPAGTIGNSDSIPKEKYQPKIVEQPKTEKVAQKPIEHEEEKKVLEEKTAINIGIIKKNETPAVEIKNIESKQEKIVQAKPEALKELPDKVSEELSYLKKDPEIAKIGFYNVKMKDAEPVSAPITSAPSEPIKVSEQKIIKESILDKRDEQRAFGLNSGQRLCSLRELLNFLPNMPEYIWHHHTKEGRNDFASWIEGVFDNKELAQEFRHAETQTDAVHVLKKYE